MQRPAWSWGTNWGVRSSRWVPTQDNGVMGRMSLYCLSFHADRAGTARPGWYRTAHKPVIWGWGRRAASPDSGVGPARPSFVLPADLPTSYCALVEPFAVGLHGVHSAGISPGDDVLIVGAG